ncbi:MAG: Spore protein SP21 [Alphaproteobacteria bacterium MarineAlpha10_Bin2]|nr:MAG: Spore protein SP21 [Alphaproteobacteria bacterium MarineAlpha10_Bin2]
MTIRCLIPRTGRTRSPVRRIQDFGLDSCDRLFDDFFRGFGIVPTLAAFEPGTFTPSVNLSETDKAIKVVAELPGLDEKEVNVELDEDTLVLQGEKKAEEEQKEDTWYRIEHSYGSFRRVIPLSAEVDGEKAKASFKKGVLTITLPKRPEAQPNKKTINITTG